MRPLRIALAVVIAIAAAWAIYAHCWLRQVCNVEENRLEYLTLKYYELADDPGVRIEARKSADRLRMWTAKFPENVNLHLILAAVYRMIDNQDAALAEYRTALRFDRRPEIYRSLGDVELATGKIEAARDTLFTACLLKSDAYSEFPEPYHTELYMRTNAVYQKLIAHTMTDADKRALRERMFRDPL